jgi:hypothetical protein
MPAVVEDASSECWTNEVRKQIECLAICKCYQGKIWTFSRESSECLPTCSNTVDRTKT